MLGTLYYKGIAGLSSMRSMTEVLNKEEVVHNLYSFIGEQEKEYLPHGETINEFLERLNPEELEEIRTDMVTGLIRRKTFNDARFKKRWLVLVDGTELDGGYKQKNIHYLSRTYHRGEEGEFTKYHQSYLEARIYLGDGLVCSIMTEPIENTAEYEGKSEEIVKQDCGQKAFERLAAKLKKAFPRLPVCIVADALYVSGKVTGICGENKWDYIIRYKEGSAPSIAEEYRAIPEKYTAGGDIEYQNKGGDVWQEKSCEVINFF